MKDNNMKRSNKRFPVNLDWRRVFDGSKGTYSNIADAFNAAKSAGYEYFTWNDRVYMCDERGLPTYYLVQDGRFKYDLDLLAEHCIGDTVVKISGKPFKSGKHEATIKGVLASNIRSKVPNYDKPAFTFEEDDSVVECLKCNFI